MYTLVIALILIFVTIVFIKLWTAARTSKTATPQDLVFTNHVEQRMRERNVARRQVEQVLAAPELTKPDTKNDSVRLERTIGGKTLIVWVVAPWPSTKSVVIKSTAWADPAITFSIPSSTITAVIGKSGSVIQRIRSDHDARISVKGTGEVRVAAPRVTQAQAAQRQILAISNAARRRPRSLQAA